MSYVAAKFPLPSVTDRNGTVLPFAIYPGRCRMDVKRGTKTIRAAAPQPRVVVVPPPMYLGGFWGSLVKGSIKLFNKVQGTKIPVPAVDSKKEAAQQQQEAVAQQQQLGPLASVSTSTLVVGGLAFSALILVLASRGR